jgi:manganese/iron transport system permease protein
MRHLLDLYSTGVMRRALVEAVLVGALCGVVGVHVVLRRLPFFTITVAHASFPGIVIAALLGIGALAGGLAFAAVLTLAVYAISADDRLGASSAVGVALAGALGLGVMLQSTQDGFTRDLTAVLIGSILTVGRGDLVTTAIVGGLVLVVVAALHKELVFRAFDPHGAAAAGYSRRLDLVLLAAVAAAVVVTVPVAGTILAVALLTIPALTARLVTDRVAPAMAVAAGCGAASAVAGLTASAQWDLAAGASIALAAGGIFSLTWTASAAAARVSARRSRRFVALA